MSTTDAMLRASRAASAAERKPPRRRLEIQEACRLAFSASADGLDRIAHGLLDRAGVSADGWKAGAAP